MIYLVQSMGYFKLFHASDKFSLELDLLEFNPDFRIIEEVEGTRDDILIFNNDHFMYRNDSGWLRQNNKIIKDFLKL